MKTMSKKQVVKSDIISIDLEKLIEVELSIEQFVFLSLIDENKPLLYEAYSKKFKNIIQSKNQLTELIDKGILKMEKADNYDFANFKVTEAFHQLFNNDKAKIIQEIKEVYPKQTPSGQRKGLQADSNKWIPKYLNIVKNNSQLHSLIIDCIKYEMHDRNLNNQAEYIPLLTTYINNARWEVYMDEVIALREKGKKVLSSSELTNNIVEDI